MIEHLAYRLHDEAARVIFGYENYFHLSMRG